MLEYIKNAYCRYDCDGMEVVSLHYQGFSTGAQLRCYNCISLLYADYVDVFFYVDDNIPNLHLIISVLLSV